MILTDPFRTDPSARSKFGQNTKGAVTLSHHGKVANHALPITCRTGQKQLIILYCWFSCTCEKLFQCQRIPHSAFRIERFFCLSKVDLRLTVDTAVTNLGTNQWPYQVHTKHWLITKSNWNPIPESLDPLLSSSNLAQWLTRKIITNVCTISCFFSFIYLLSLTRVVEAKILGFHFLPPLICGF